MALSGLPRRFWGYLVGSPGGRIALSALVGFVLGLSIGWLVASRPDIKDTEKIAAGGKVKVSGSGINVTYPTKPGDFAKVTLEQGVVEGDFVVSSERIVIKYLDRSMFVVSAGFLGSAFTGGIGYLTPLGPFSVGGRFVVRTKDLSGISIGKLGLEVAIGFRKIGFLGF